MRLRHRKPQIEGFWREQSTLGSLIYLKAMYGRIYFFNSCHEIKIVLDFS